ncbi:MAG: FKBP-type peptidyl-prolyl cis-trans isomerase [Bacillota bacterium]|nr:FKBP-type peptidyl-prolyl cis-trans isomerase [Bacillota bacterium]
MNKMTKMLSLILAIAMVFAMAGCGEEKKEEGTQYKYDYETFDYKTGLDEDGFFVGVKALDYVTLPDIDNIVVTSEEVQEQVDDIMNDTQYMKEVENSSATATVANGDTVNIDYVGSIDGVEFDGGSTGGTGTDVTIGVTSYIDDFLEQLIGHHPGETINVEVTFPDDYGNEDLNGKDALFVTKINYIVEYEKYELTDEWVQTCFMDTDGFTSVADFMDACKNNAGYLKVAADVTFADDMPEDVMDICVARQIRTIYDQAASYQMDVDTLVSYQFGSYGISSIGQVISAYDAYKEISAQETLFYQAICEQAGLTVSDQDVQDYYDYNVYDEEGIKSLEDNLTRPYIKSLLLQDKAVKYIYEHCQLAQ